MNTRLQEFKNNSNNIILSVNIPSEIMGENSLPMKRFNKSMKNNDRIAKYARKIASINSSARASQRTTRASNSFTKGTF